MNFLLPGGGALRIRGQALGTIRAFADRSREREAGGILLGRCYARDVSIESVSTPGDGDSAGPTSFSRSAARAQAIINRSWDASTGELIYLGEWHSHAEARPHPSPTDRGMIRLMRAGTRMEISFLFLVIVGWEGLWVGIDNGRKLQRLAEE